MDYPVSRLLYEKNPWDLGNGTVCIPQDQCFCEDWLKSRGSYGERRAAIALQWATFGLCVVCLMWYAYESWKATVGWEEVYVATIEMVKFIIEAFHEFDSPAMLMLSNGNMVPWLRYGEWLLTCPVILIHLSNLTGLKDDYSKRTMGLLVSDVGCIVWGTTAAMSQSYVRIIFFLLALAYGMYTYFHAAKVYIESYHTVPKGICRDLVRILAWLYFVSWGLFPVLFLLGPEGFGHISQYASAIAHSLLDIASKNAWGLLGHYLRVKIHEHILLYGDIRKKTTINVAGQEMEVETMVAQEDEDTIKQPTAKYASRDSFIIMRNRLREKGFEVRASLDGDTGGEEQGNAGGGGNNGSGGNGGAVLTKTTSMAAGNKMALEMGAGNKFGGGSVGPAAIEPGRVILAVPDISMVDFFREQFAQLPVPYEVVPALGADNSVQLVQQASSLGGCDFVLLHPEFLRDKGPNGLLLRLKMMGQRTAAFGWSQMGPMRDMIESSGVDGWLEGPSFGAGISQAGLVQLIARMQQARKMGAMIGAGMMGAGMGMGMGGMMGGNNSGLMGAGSGMMGNNSGLMGAGSGMMGNNGLMTAGSGMMGNNGVYMGAGNGGLGMGNGTGNNGQGAVAGGAGGLMSQGSMMGGAGMHGGTGLMSAGSGMINMNNNNNNNNNGAGMGMGGGGGMLQPQMSVGAALGGMSPMQAPSGMSAARVGTNPLFGAPPSPQSSQPGVIASGLGAPSPQMPVAAAGNASEAEMLQQLMSEINRLKNELGE